MTTFLTTKRVIILFTIIVCIKTIHASFLGYLTTCSNPETKLSAWAFSSGDTFSYTEAMENYIQKGSYFFFNGTQNIYAGRLPHYSIPYWIFRQFLNVENAYNALVFFQILVEAIAVTLALRLCYLLTSNIKVSFILFIVLMLASNWTQLSIYASPESLSCSFCILFIYFYYLHAKSKRNIHLLLAGTFLGLLISLKAYFILVFAVAGAHWLFENGLTISGLKKTAILSIWISIPLFLLLSPWVIRNYNIYHRFIPLQESVTAGYNYSTAELAYRKYLGAWGGDFIYWEKTSAGCYFMPHPDIPCEYTVPSYVYTSSIKSAEVENVRSKYIQLQNHYSDSLNRTVTEEFNSMAIDYQQQKPLRYYLVSPLILLTKFVKHSGSYYLPIHASNPCYHFLQLPVKLIQSIFYWASIVLGIPGLLLFSVRTKNYTMASLPFLLFIIFPVALRAVEWRYLRTIEPILYFGIIFLIDYFVIKRDTKAHQA